MEKENFKKGNNSVVSFRSTKNLWNSGNMEFHVVIQ